MYMTIDGTDYEIVDGPSFTSAFHNWEMVGNWQTNNADPALQTDQQYRYAKELRLEIYKMIRETSGMNVTEWQKSNKVRFPKDDLEFYNAVLFKSHNWYFEQEYEKRFGKPSGDVCYVEIEGKHLPLPDVEMITLHSLQGHYYVVCHSEQSKLWTALRAKKCEQLPDEDIWIFYFSAIAEFCHEIRGDYILLQSHRSEDNPAYCFIELTDRLFAKVDAKLFPDAA